MLSFVLLLLLLHLFCFQSLPSLISISTVITYIVLTLSSTNLVLVALAG